MARAIDQLRNHIEVSRRRVASLQERCKSYQEQADILEQQIRDSGLDPATAIDTVNQLQAQIQAEQGRLSQLVTSIETQLDALGV